MRRLSAIALVLLPLGASAVDLPPVDVPLPPDEPDQSSSPATRDPSGSVTVVDATAHGGEAKDVAALLAPTAGAVVTDSGGVGQSKSLSLRGASANGVLVLLDGVPLGGPGCSMDLARIPAPIIDKLEVLRGGAGARYGPGGLGGVVNVVTRRPTTGARLFADVSQGSFTTTLASAGASGSLLGGEGLLVLHGARSAGDFSYQVDPQPELDGNALVTQTRQNNQALLGGGLLKYRAALPRGWSLDALAEGHGLSRGLAGTALNPTPDAHELAARATGALRATKDFEAGGQLQTLAWGRADWSTLQGGPFGPAPYAQTQTGAGAELTFTRLFAERHGLTALVSGTYEGLREPSGANPAWGRLGAMVGDEVLFFDGDVSVNGSVRLDQSGRFTTFSPKAGAVVRLPKGFELRANVGQAARPPSFSELYVVQGNLLPNPELQPERALYVDGAALYRHRRGFLSVGGFYSLYENLIAYEYYPPQLSRPYNFMAASASGLELEGTVEPSRWLSASAGYTLMFTQNLKDDERYWLKSLPYRPRHKVSARVAAGPKWLRARGEVLFQSEQFVNRTQTIALPARTFVNVGASSTPFENPAVTVSLEVKNLLDVQSADLDGYPLPPRSIFLTLAVAWDAVSPQGTP